MSYDYVDVPTVRIPKFSDTGVIAREDITSGLWRTKSLIKQRRQFRVTEKRPSSSSSVLELQVGSSWRLFPYYGCVRIHKLITADEHDLHIEVLLKFDDGLFVSSKVLRCCPVSNQERIAEGARFKAAFVVGARRKFAWWYGTYIILWYKPVFYGLRLLRKLCRFFAKSLVSAERLLLPF